MPTVHFVDCKGNPRDIEVPEGCTLMEIALENDVEGIVAGMRRLLRLRDLPQLYRRGVGGQAAPIDDMEDAMLDCALERKSNSRLTCQIQMTAELAGLRLTAADNEA